MVCPPRSPFCLALFLQCCKVLPAGLCQRTFRAGPSHDDGPPGTCRCQRCRGLMMCVRVSFCFCFALLRLFFCLFACLSACLPDCLSACLPVFPSVCPTVCLPASLPPCLSVCLSVCPSVCLFVLLRLEPRWKGAQAFRQPLSRPVVLRRPRDEWGDRPL